MDSRHALQVFYVHVMKTGGTSLGESLRSRFAPADAYPQLESDHAPVAEKTFPYLLLDLDEEARRRTRLFSVHHPAWVAFEIAPTAQKITVIREPISRTVSHLRQLANGPHAPDDMNEIYDNPGWRSRLANYQTQLFANTKERHDAAKAATAISDEAAAKILTEELHLALSHVWGTAIEHPFDVTTDDLARAIETLERFDVVGVTEKLDDMVERLSIHMALELPPLDHQNTTGQRLAVSDGLMERIEADNPFDLQLYAHAQTLAGARP
jgi:hypothetical protein